MATRHRARSYTWRMDRGVSNRRDASTIAPFRRLSVAIALTIQSITQKRENNGFAKIDRVAARRRANGGRVLGYPSAHNTTTTTATTKLWRHLPQGVHMARGGSVKVQPCALPPPKLTLPGLFVSRLMAFMRAPGRRFPLQRSPLVLQIGLPNRVWVPPSPARSVALRFSDLRPDP